MELKINDRVFFEPLTHSYVCGDRLLVGVTSLMKKHGLSADYSGVDPKVLERAAVRGTAVHEMLETWDDGGQALTGDVKDEDGRTVVKGEMMRRILKNYAALKLPVLASEYLVSDDETVASSIDKVVASEEPDTVELADVKTTSVFHRDAVSVQLGIYSVLLRIQNPGLKVGGCFGIHVDMRTGSVKTVPVEPWPEENVLSLLEAERRGEIWGGASAAPERSLESVLTGAEVSEYLGIVRRLDEAERAAKELSSRLSGYRKRLAAWMEANGTDELTAEGGRVRLRRAYSRKTLDGKALQRDLPEVYGRYSRETTVEASATFEFDK